MVIDDLDVERVAVPKREANAPARIISSPIDRADLPAAYT